MRRREARHRLLDELLAPVILRVAIAELVRHRQIQRGPPHHCRAYRLLEKVHRRLRCHSLTLRFYRPTCSVYIVPDPTNSTNQERWPIDVRDSVHLGV